MCLDSFHARTKSMFAYMIIHERSKNYPAHATPTNRKGRSTIFHSSSSTGVKEACRRDLYAFGKLEKICKQKRERHKITHRDACSGFFSFFFFCLLVRIIWVIAVWPWCDDWWHAPKSASIINHRASCPLIRFTFQYTAKGKRGEKRKGRREGGRRREITQTTRRKRLQTFYWFVHKRTRPK